MNRLKTIFLVFIPAALLTFVSCEKKEKITVGFLMSDFNSTRWELDKKYVEEKVKELGGEIITKISNGDENMQYSQAMELIKSGVDVLVIVPTNVNTAAAIVREAHNKNIKVIAYARLIKNSELDYFIGFDAFQIGQLQAEFALKEKPSGNYVLIEGDYTDINAVYLENGQKETLKKSIENGDINVLYRVFVENWSPDNASHEIEKVLKLTDKKIDVILAANDGTSSGVIKVLEKYGLKKDIIVTGADAELAACQRVYHGEQNITIYMPVKKLAQTAATLAYDIVSNKKLDQTFAYKDNGRVEVPSLILHSIIINKENLEVLVEEGLYTMEEITSPN